MTTIDRAIQRAIIDIKKVCESEGSKSQYFVYGGEGYKSGMRHFLESSTEIAAGCVQPGSKEDLAKIIKIVAKHRAPFAVKCGGHSTNPHFSSTKGIQIHLSRFNKVVVKKNVPDFSTSRRNESIVQIGAGCLFDEVYRAVVPHGLNVVGGSSISGVGVGGWFQGGGYSLKSNQYGLGVDNILQLEIVLPTGEIKTVNNQSKGDDGLLFKVAKAGGNNFGIITEYTVRPHAQKKPICGALLQYEVEDFEDVKTAVINFTQKQVPEASLISTFRYTCGTGGVDAALTVLCFYDGPLPKDNNPFAELLDIDHRSQSGAGDEGGMESGKKKYSNSPAPGVPTKRAGLVEYDDYYFFDHHTSLVKEMLHEPGVQLDKIVPMLPAHTHMEFDEDESEADTATSAQNISGIKSERAPMAMAARNFAAASRTETQSSSIENLYPQSQNFIKRAMVGVAENPRGRWGNVMVDVYTKDIIDEMGRQASKAAREMPGHGGRCVAIDVWPFAKTMFDHATECAWPHIKLKGGRNGPILAYFLWEGAENDDFWILQMERALKAIKKKVDKARGPNAKPLPVHLSLTLNTTSVEDIYLDNLEMLKEARKKFDPNRVMDLTGGFRIPHPDYRRRLQPGEE